MTTAKSTTKKKTVQAEAAPPIDFKAMAEATRQKMAAANEKGKVGREKKLDLNGAQRSGGKLASRDIPTDVAAPKFQKGDLVTVLGSTLDGGSSIRGVVTGHQPTPKGIEYLVTLPAEFDGEDGEEGAYLFRDEYLERRPTDPRDYSVPFQVGDRVRYFGPHAAHKGDWTVLEVLRSGSCVVGVDKSQFTLMHGHLRILGRADVGQALRDLDMSREPETQKDRPFPVSELELEATLPSETTGEALEPEQTPHAELPGTPVLLPPEDLQPLETAAPAAARPLLQGADVRNIALRALHPSPLNPRKHFDEGKLAELAESIAHQGLMQNLVIRPNSAQGGGYEVIAGGRRLRALKLLAEQGRIPESYMVPVRVQHLSDLDALMLATAENADRADVSPLEEADAYAHMITLGATPEDIALRFGRTEKHVQQRLVLARDLGDKARKLLEKGEIGIGQAQVIAQTTGPLRKHVVEAAQNGRSASEMRRLIQQASFLVERAKFDVATSGLDIVEDLYGDAPARFADPKAAMAKQLDWVKARAAHLEGKKEQHFVEIREMDSHYLSAPYSEFDRYDPPKELRGTLIMVSTVTGEVQEARCARSKDVAAHSAKQRAKDQKSSSAEATGTEGGAIRKAALIDGHQARASALRTALIGDHKRTVALGIMALLGSNESNLQVNDHTLRLAETPAVKARLMELDARLGGALDVENHWGEPYGFRVNKRQGDCYGGTGAKDYAFLTKLLELTLEELLDLHGLLIAEAYGGWVEYRPEMPPSLFMTRLSADVGANVTFTLTDTHLKAYPRDRLLELAADARIGEGPDGKGADLAALKTSKDVRAAILEHAEALAHRNYVPAVARFPKTET
ncbi:ParB/RepB/Spo0J family partition protein [Deinococcus taklimakanensis]|uniref:ParB/RepB/Spo0J family partition protein n=1 Tax=Deinococcus taklimakanensis TaxID=536443 RepID=A0ABW5P489_9DEIO